MNYSDQQSQNNKRNDFLNNRFELLIKISEGAYGVVYRAFDHNTNKLVAIKKIKQVTNGQGMTSTNVRELSTLKTLNHENIISLLDQFITIYKSQTSLSNSNHAELFLIFEYIEMDLHKYIQSYHQIRSYIPPIQIQSIMFQLVKGIYAIHSNSLIHRDIKSHNILITKEGQVKIADMGLTRRIEKRRQNMTPNMITLHYRPLEMLKGQCNYTNEVDIWSIGCVFSELCLLYLMFKGANEHSQAVKIISQLGLPTEFQDFMNYKEIVPQQTLNFEQTFPFLSADGQDLLKRMLEINPSQRITAKECLEHPYFDDIKNISLEQIHQKTMESIPEYQIKFQEVIKADEQRQREKDMRNAKRLQEQQQLQQQYNQNTSSLQKQDSFKSQLQKQDSLEASPEPDL